MLINRADEVINICEIKYASDKYALTAEYEEKLRNSAETIKLRNRAASFKQETGAKGALWPTLITTYGLKDGMHSSTFVETLTMDDLFK